MQVIGHARRFGDDVNTDYIISSSRKRQTIDPSILKEFLFESIDREFAASVRPGDLIVAGRNFGCGSAMEVAATVLQAAGIRAVLARSFARSFYRNAINNGLLVVECDTNPIGEGDRLIVRYGGGRVAVDCSGYNPIISGTPIPDIVMQILASGGLSGYLVANGGFDSRV